MRSYHYRTHLLWWVGRHCPVACHPWSSLKTSRAAWGVGLWVRCVQELVENPHPRLLRKRTLWRNWRRSYRGQHFLIQASRPQGCYPPQGYHPCKSWKHVLGVAAHPHRCQWTCNNRPQGTTSRRSSNIYHSSTHRYDAVSWWVFRRTRPIVVPASQPWMSLYYSHIALTHWYNYKDNTM